MPQLGSSPPEALRPFLFHGLDLNWRSGSDEATGECPFCGKHKLSVNTQTGQWRCFVCNTGAENGKVVKGGNIYSFLRALHDLAAGLDDAGEGECHELLANRNLLTGRAIGDWGIRTSPITGEWLLPGYDLQGRMNNLYRYVEDGKGHRAWRATATLEHCLHSSLGKIPSHLGQTVWLAEGPWDALALEEMLAGVKKGEKGLEITGNEQVSLLHDASVIAVPGCNVFNLTWLPLFAGKDVVLLYDNDHPKVLCAGCRKSHSRLKHVTCPTCPTCRKPLKGTAVPPAGPSATERVVGLLAGAEEPPRSIRYLRWGKDETYSGDLADGWDVRDELTQGGDSVTGRIPFLQRVLDRLAEPPQSWAAARPVKVAKPGDQVKYLACTSYRQLVNSWRKALKWTEGLDGALAVMLATIFSTRSIGEQLWVMILSPASGGKTTLCEAVSVNKTYTFAKSTIRGFHSGDKSEGKDNGLVPRLKGKTLVTKDGDTLMQSPNLAQILSEARDLYDATARVSYRNGVDIDHSGVRMTWILCGTGSLRAMDHSEVGERFLKYSIMDGIDEALEDEILRRKAYRAVQELDMQADGKLETQHSPEMLEAMLLTGGYIQHLCTRAAQLMPSVQVPNSALDDCIRFGKLVAYLRARPSRTQDEVAEREMATRLVSQHVRLAKCLAAVLNKVRVDDEVMARVRAVCHHTAKGKTQEIARWLYEGMRPEERGRNRGMESPSLAVYLNETDDRVRKLLRFLRRIGVVDVFIRKVGMSNRKLWRLTPSLMKLYSQVYQVPLPEPETVDE